MTSLRPTANFPFRERMMALGVYAAVIVALVATTWIALADIGARRTTTEAVSDMLARIEGRSPAAGRRGRTGEPAVVPTGSPFLEAPTVTVAGAVLLQRLASAITGVGGNVLSSQVDLDGENSKNGFVTIIASCEIEHASLQQLIYDVEAGMPFLFIEQLVAQAPAVQGGPESARMRLLIAVSGQWREGK